MQAASHKHLRVKMVSSALPKNSSLSLSESEMASRIAALSKQPLQHPIFRKVPHRNGIISPVRGPSPKLTPNTRPNHVSAKLVGPKTEGKATSEQSSLTDTPSKRAKLVCPDLAVSYTGSILGNRSGQLVSRQQDLETQLSSLQKKLREKQLVLVHDHAKSQLASLKDGDRRSSLGWSRNGSTSSLSTSSLEQREDRVPTKIDMQVDGTMAEPPLPKRPHVDLEEPEQDMLQESSVDERMDVSLPLSSNSLLTLSDWTDEDLVSTAVKIQEQLGNLESLVDGELTDFSSDEEAEERKKTMTRPLASAKKEWERDRASLGSRWAWLEHRIAELNSQICRLDSKLQHRPTRERFLLAPPILPPSSLCQLPNSGLLEQLHRGGNGSLLAVAAGLGKGGRGTNGVNHHTPSSFPQLFITEGPLGTSLQVKDLLTPSPLGRNFSIILNETGCTSARTRPLEKRAHRRIVRMKKRREWLRGEGSRVDSSHHPQLSLPQELPSRIWLDRAVHRIGLEHSYSCMPLPLSKRRKAASFLPPMRNISRPPSRFDRSSASPSPINTPGSLDKDRAKVPRKKPFLQPDSHPDSPGLPYPSTPLTVTPHQRNRKRPPTSTPSYDIDNIVIPYSMACSARPEKLEYKEILTPSWREVEPPIVNGNDTDATAAEKPLSNHCSEEEDLSDEVFARRHEKCELGEKKRFMNFITGSQKKRARPHSLGSTPDGSQVGSPRPFPSQGKLPKGLVSPASLDGDFWQPHVLPWSPRPFPLSEKDMELLHNPVPPPRAVRPSPSPSPMLTRPCTPVQSPALKSHTPLSSCSSLATPFTTPLSSPSTPYGELPLLSPSEWMVINNTSLSSSRNSQADVSTSSGSSSESHSLTGIVLKLSKKT